MPSIAIVETGPGLGLSIAKVFGSHGFDVLEYSPYSGLVRVSPLEVTVNNLQPQIEHHLYGAVTAVQTVLPAMLQAGSGSLLFTTGGGAITPYPMLSAMNAAQAALRNWVINLNGVLSDKGVYAGNVAINVFIGATAPQRRSSCRPGRHRPGLLATPYPSRPTRTRRDRLIGLSAYFDSSDYGYANRLR
jgi:NAD(P)-dependent dehydrogenase (short-subunit alcohol dehydrogenase family)